MLGFEHLRETFFGQILKGAAQLFDFGAVWQAHPTQHFRRKGWQTCELHLLAFGEGVADTNGTMVGDTDHIAWPGFLRDLAILRKEHDRAVYHDILACSDLTQLHAALEVARADAHEGHAVAMVGIHVGLYLEDEAGNLFLIWRYRAYRRR